jgi:hypothetical protein
MFVRYRTNLLAERASESTSLRSFLMSFKKFRVVAQTNPPSADSADEQARWGKLADVLLRPDVSKTESATATTTRAHQEHERLKQEIRDSLDWQLACPWDNDLGNHVHGATAQPPSKKS